MRTTCVVEVCVDALEATFSSINSSLGKLEQLALRNLEFETALMGVSSTKRRLL